VEKVILDKAFWAKRRVLLTGHTGFKGAWTARWLSRLGAEVAGYSLPPEGEPNLFSLLGPCPNLKSRLADLRDGKSLREAVAESDPEIVIHMAAQALVPRSYRFPVETWSVNVLGTIMLLDALRDRSALKAVIVVTSDKVYANDGAARGDSGGFVESDRLGGDDPYSASKAACELAVNAWRASFAPSGPPVATARAGNVIGGGDWAEDRLIPDFVRALAAKRALELRQPKSVRPWQHVLDPVAGYLLLAEHLATGKKLPFAFNFGPSGKDLRTTLELVERLYAAFQRKPDWRHVAQPGIGEKKTLILDAGLAQKTLGWRPRLSIDQAIDWTVEWYAAHSAGSPMAQITDAQIARYESLA
jgi:CDP-glucose 4,6-dehydratase